MSKSKRDVRTWDLESRRRARTVFLILLVGAVITWPFVPPLAGCLFLASGAFSYYLCANCGVLTANVSRSHGRSPSTLRGRLAPGVAIHLRIPPKPMNRTLKSSIQMDAVGFGIDLSWLGRAGGAIQRRLSPIRYAAWGSSMKNVHIFCVFLAATLIIACRTIAIPAIEPIELPPGLSMQEIELVIFAGVLNKPLPEGFNPREPMTDEEFQAFIWQHFLRAASTRSWFPESRAHGVVRAAVDNRDLYLRVALHFDESRITIAIEDSRGLDRTATHIHKRGAQWLLRLREHINREVRRMKFGLAPAAQHLSDPPLSTGNDVP